MLHLFKCEYKLKNTNKKPYKLVHIINIYAQIALCLQKLELEIQAIYAELKVNNRIHCVIVAYNNGLVFA
jgi:hypothetical protein